MQVARSRCRRRTRLRRRWNEQRRWRSISDPATRSARRTARWRGSRNARDGNSSGGCCRGTTTFTLSRSGRFARREPDRVLRTFRRPSTRPLLTIAGRVDVVRVAYQARDVDGIHPMDALLNLPRELYSHEVRRRAAEHAALRLVRGGLRESERGNGEHRSQAAGRRAGGSCGAGLRRLLRSA